MKIKVEDPTRFVKKMFWIAWSACGGPTGMGHFQNNASATEYDVFSNVCTAGDYPGGSNEAIDSFYGDYVFGRMMKWGCRIVDGIVVMNSQEFRRDYQGFSGTYCDDNAIANAAAAELGINIEIIE